MCLLKRIIIVVLVVIATLVSLLLLLLLPTSPTGLTIIVVYANTVDKDVCGEYSLRESKINDLIKQINQKDS